MRINILCTAIIINLFSLVENASSLKCGRSLVCGSDRRVYETTCDFQRALRLNQELATIPLQECLDYVYVAITPKHLSALNSFPYKSTTRTGRRFIFVPFLLASAAKAAAAAAAAAKVAAAAAAAAKVAAVTAGAKVAAAAVAVKTATTTGTVAAVAAAKTTVAAAATSVGTATSAVGNAVNVVRSAQTVIRVAKAGKDALSIGKRIAQGAQKHKMKILESVVDSTTLGITENIDSVIILTRYTTKKMKQIIKELHQAIMRFQQTVHGAKWLEKDLDQLLD